MKNKKSIYLIVSFSLIVGLLHFLIGPNYQGIYKPFIRGYLIDILLPLNLYLLLQISLRRKISVYKARIIAAVSTFSFGTIVEILQLNEINFLGRTYDFLDVGLSILIDLTIITKFEKMETEK